jgi:3,4-dihydroxy 2-butanone 4-phosphate synthase/GTP cyclohydrolase II
MNPDGAMARLPQLEKVAQKFDLKIISISDMIAHRLKTDSIIERGDRVSLPTKWGCFDLIVFRQKSNGMEHIALVKGSWKNDEPVLVRVHSSCATGDILGSCRCDCGAQLHEAMRMVEQEGRGVILYLNQEGRGIGLFNKIHAYKLQEQGLDTVEANLAMGFGADERDYGVGASMLHDLGVRKMRLMSNNPLKRKGLEGYNLEVIEAVPIIIKPNDHNRRYLQTKEQKMGHRLFLKN